MPIKRGNYYQSALSILLPSKPLENKRNYLIKTEPFVPENYYFRVFFPGFGAVKISHPPYHKNCFNFFLAIRRVGCLWIYVALSKNLSPWISAFYWKALNRMQRHVYIISYVLRFYGKLPIAWKLLHFPLHKPS